MSANDKEVIQKIKHITEEISELMKEYQKTHGSHEDWKQSEKLSENIGDNQRRMKIPTQKTIDKSNAGDNLDDVIKDLDSAAKMAKEKLKFQ